MEGYVYKLVENTLNNHSKEEAIEINEIKTVEGGGIKMYRYFISYNFNDNKGFGFANCEAQRNKKINNIIDIKEIAKKIKEKNSFKDVVILNYKLLNEEDI